jgi:hypothetical protein
LIFLSRLVVEVDHDRMIFGRFCALMQEHQMFALLSTLRLHKSGVSFITPPPTATF